MQWAVLDSQGYTRGSLPQGSPRGLQGRRQKQNRAEVPVVGEWLTEVSAHTDLSFVPTSSSFKYTCMSWALLPSPAPGVHKDLLLEA